MMWLGAAVGRLTDILDLGVLRRWSLSGVGGAHLPSGGSPSASGRTGTMAVPDPGARTIPRPLHADWAWRPAPWAAPVDGLPRHGVASGTPLGRGVKLFHDCPHADCAVRQLRHPVAEAGVAGVEIEVGQFDGGFLSLAIDLPPDAVAGLSRRHLLGVSISCDADRPVAVYARANLRHGPNLAQVVRARDGEARIDLDLALTELDEDRVQAGWVDLIFDAPAMNRIVLSDVTMSRRPRAEF